MSKNIYIFSGLGADERVFQKINFSNKKITFISWIIPQNNESIEHYSKRLLEQITTDKPILIGLSFGGMIAVEVSKLIETEKIILISSVKTKKEIPFIYRILGKLKLHKIIPFRIFQSSNFITNWFFGLRSESEKLLLKQILRETDPLFFRWAIDKITQWSNLVIPPNYFHIHGEKDRLFPLRNIKCDSKIKNGGHFMIMNKSKELNLIIKGKI